MLSRRVTNFFRGWLTCSVTGGFLPEFTTLCGQYNIMLENTKPCSGGLLARTALRNEENLQLAARKAGMTFCVLQRGGLPVLAARYRWRWGIPAGLLAAAVLVGLLSSAVWSVRVSGCERLSEEYILSFFTENGVRRGAFRAGLDVTELRTRALSELEGVLWITLHIDGCRAEIEVRERGIVPVLPEKNMCSNILAARDGEILRADVFAGESQLKAGQPVVKGDLLVSGTVPLKNGGVRFVRAQANIIARTHRTVEMAVAEQQRVVQLVGWRRGLSLSLFSLRVPLWFTGKNDKIECSASYLTAGETVLPLGFFREHRWKTEEAEVTLSERQQLLWCFAGFAESELNSLRGATVLERKLSVTHTDGILRLTGQYICEENICEEATVLLTEE